MNVEKRTRQIIPYYYQVSFITHVVVTRRKKKEKELAVFLHRIAIMQFFSFNIFFSPSLSLFLSFLLRVFFFVCLSFALFYCISIPNFYVILRYVFASTATCYFGLLRSFFLSFFLSHFSCNHHKHM